jgi:catechol 2,3-dioxygenase-like lactoylglutathione lyase family enzyme
MRVRHIGLVVSELESAADFYCDILDFKRLSDVRTPGEFPGKAIDLSDGEVNVTLLEPNENVERLDWCQGTMGPNHIGITISDPQAVIEKLKRRGVEVYAVEKAQPPRFFKFRGPDDVEIDVATEERSWRR